MILPRPPAEALRDVYRFVTGAAAAAAARVLEPCSARRERFVLMMVLGTSFRPAPAEPIYLAARASSLASVSDRCTGLGQGSTWPWTSEFVAQYLRRHKHATCDTWFSSISALLRQ